MTLLAEIMSRGTTYPIIEGVGEDRVKRKVLGCFSSHEYSFLAWFVSICSFDRGRLSTLRAPSAGQCRNIPVTQTGQPRPNGNGCSRENCFGRPGATLRQGVSPAESGEIHQLRTFRQVWEQMSQPHGLASGHSALLLRIVTHHWRFGQQRQKGARAHVAPTRATREDTPRVSCE